MTSRNLIIAAACTLLSASPALASTVITFDEYPAQNANGTIPANQYSSLGVTFSGTDDGSTWSGLSAGDPGSWGIEGTNGTNFAGFNGDSYSLSLLFSSDVTSFALDASRSNGSVDGTVTLQAYENGSLVDTVSQTLGAINSWSTLSLTGTFNSVTISGTGTDFHPFGVDNIRFDPVTSAVPEPSTWALMLIGFGAMGLSIRRRGKPVMAQLA